MFTMYHNLNRYPSPWNGQRENSCLLFQAGVVTKYAVMTLSDAFKMSQTYIKTTRLVCVPVSAYLKRRFFLTFWKLIWKSYRETRLDERLKIKNENCWNFLNFFPYRQVQFKNLQSEKTVFRLTCHIENYAKDLILNQKSPCWRDLSVTSTLRWWLFW